MTTPKNVKLKKPLALSYFAKPPGENNFPQKKGGPSFSNPKIGG